MKVLTRRLWSILIVIAVVVLLSLVHRVNDTLDIPLIRHIVVAGDSGNAKSSDINFGNVNSGNAKSRNVNSGNINYENVNSRDAKSGNVNSGNINSGNVKSGKGDGITPNISQSRSRSVSPAVPKIVSTNVARSETEFHSGTGTLNNSTVNPSEEIANEASSLDHVALPYTSGTILEGYTSLTNPNINLQLNCSKCAYVSSSGQLRGSRAGHLIDAFPCIIRMNDAPTHDFEDDVGSKTTIRVTAFSSMGFIMPKKDVLFKGANEAKIMLLWGPEAVMNRANKKSAYSVAKQLQHKMAAEGLQVFLVSQEEYDKAHNIYHQETKINVLKTRTWLSTGWFTMLFARELCDEIHVFGMVPQDHCKKNKDSKVPYHYYQPTGIHECREYRKGERINAGGHHFHLEKAAFARWSKLEPNIFFNYPEWPVL